MGSGVSVLVKIPTYSEIYQLAHTNPLELAEITVTLASKLRTLTTLANYARKSETPEEFYREIVDWLYDE